MNLYTTYKNNLLVHCGLKQNVSSSYLKFELSKVLVSANTRLNHTTFNQSINQYSC